VLFFRLVDGLVKANATGQRFHTKYSDKAGKTTLLEYTVFQHQAATQRVSYNPLRALRNPVTTVAPRLERRLALIEGGRNG